jgi:hypothetical protein
MRTYYRRHDAIVTSELFFRRASPAQTFARPARWELWATYRGQPVMVYSCADVRVFNQVTRALHRAIEDGRTPAVRAVDEAA